MQVLNGTYTVLQISSTPQEITSEFCLGSDKRNLMAGSCHEFELLTRFLAQNKTDPH